MTCGEFKHDTASLTLWELSRIQSKQLLGHAGECSKCGAWLQEQRMLAANMHSLQSLTAGCEAGPNVQRTVLRAFRQQQSEVSPPAPADPLTPLAWRLSRFFEVGAYVAVAAAIVIVLFLGVRLWEQRSGDSSAHNQPAQPSANVPVMAAREAASGVQQQPSAELPHGIHRLRPVVSRRRALPATAVPSQVSADDEGYVALMLCDPLSCSSDAQVVRMELPAQSGQSVQTADLVVGYDGVVRAVRIVN